jgi:hypothetical protein
VVHSPNRVSLIGKYLVATSTAAKEKGKTSQEAQNRASGRRRQLHILYILNDLLHHTKYHEKELAAHSTLTGHIQPFLIELFGLAAAYEQTRYVKHHRRVSDLLGIWSQYGYFSSSFIDKLRNTVTNVGQEGGQNSQGHSQQDDEGDLVSAKQRRDAPYIMPATHGDASAPYYELPAANMMPHIVPNSAIPIDPQAMKALQFVAGPADQSLVNAVKGFLGEVDLLYGQKSPEDEGISMDIDEMGQIVLKDEVTGEAIGGEGYYGWSKAFCEKMQRRKRGLEDKDDDGRRGLSESRSRSPSRSRSRSGTPRKRRRCSSSRSRCPSRNRNASRPRERNDSRTSSRSRSRSNHKFSRRYSPSPQGIQGRAGYSPPPSFSNLAPPPPLPQALPPNVPVPSGPSPPLPIPNFFPHGVPIGPNGLPIPPPPPPGYNGPWPPPPPPTILPGQAAPIPFQTGFSQIQGLAGQPPPPPPQAGWSGPRIESPNYQGWSAHGSGNHYNRGRDPRRGGRGGW